MDTTTRISNSEKRRADPEYQPGSALLHIQYNHTTDNQSNYGAVQKDSKIPIIWAKPIHNPPKFSLLPPMLLRMDFLYSIYNLCSDVKHIHCLHFSS